MGSGAKLLAVGTIAVGIAFLLFFDTAFTLFHQLFFAEGSWTFDPATDRLVQLFPYQFWTETSVAIAVVGLGLTIGVWALAARLAGPRRRPAGPGGGRGGGRRPVVTQRVRRLAARLVAPSLWAARPHPDRAGKRARRVRAGHGGLVRQGCGSRASRRRDELEHLIAGVTVGEVMETEALVVAPQATLDTFGDSLDAQGATTVARVMRDDRLLGIVGMRELARVPRGRWQAVHAADAMSGADALPALAPGDALSPAADRLGASSASGFPVLDDGRIAGILTRLAVGRMLHEGSLGTAGTEPPAGERGRGAAGRGSAGRGAGGPGSGPGLTMVDLLRVEEARARVLAAVTHALPAEVIPVVAARGRVLAAAVVAATDLPPWDNSAMDGYAVRAADIATAAEQGPISLVVTGEVAAGRAPDVGVAPGIGRSRRHRSAAAPGRRHRRAGGADDAPGRGRALPVRAAATPWGPCPRPSWCTRRCPRERTSAAAGPTCGGGRRSWSRVGRSGRRRLPWPPAPGCRSSRSGGRRVAVISTGDELRPAGTDLGAAGIPDSNGPGLVALCAAAGADSRHLGIGPDDLAAMTRMLREAIEAADVVIVSGGVSVGPYDVVKPAFEAVGTVDLWRVAVQPGKPFAFGTAARALGPGRDPTPADAAPESGNRVLLLGLPGNPVSTFVTFELFVRPVLRRLGGRPDWDLLAPDRRRRAGGAGHHVARPPGVPPRRRPAGPSRRAAASRFGGAGPRPPGGRAGEPRAVGPRGLRRARRRARIGRRAPGRGAGRALVARPPVTGPADAPGHPGGAMDDRQPRTERRRLSHVDRRGRPRMVDVSDKAPTARRAVAEAEVACSQETLTLVIDGGGPEGRRPDRRRACRRHGSQADLRADPALPPAAAHRRRRSDHAGPRGVGVPDPRGGRHDGADRRGDGGAHRRQHRRAHPLRHGQGRGEGRRDPVHPARGEERREVGRVAAPARSGGGGRSTERATPRRPGLDARRRDPAHPPQDRRLSAWQAPARRSS